MPSTRLIEQIVSGKSAQYVIDALVEELPPLPALRSSIMRDLPRGTQVAIDGEIVYVTAPDADKYELHEQVEFLRRVYPELEFVVK